MTASHGQNFLEGLVELYHHNSFVRNVTDFVIGPAFVYYGVKLTGDAVSLITGDSTYSTYAQLVAPIAGGGVGFRNTFRLPRTPARRLLQMVYGAWLGHDLFSALSQYSGNINLLESGRNAVHTLGNYIGNLFLNRPSPELAGAVTGAVTVALASRG